MISLSDIDRKRFGIVTARVNNTAASDLDDIDAFCRKNAVQMLVARCGAGDLAAAQAMEGRGYLLMDTLVYCAFDFARKPLPSPGAHPVRGFRAGEEAEVRQVALAAFAGYKGGHYHSDPRLDPAKCDEVYADWAFNVCTSKAAAEEVLVNGQAGAIAGFISYQKDGNIPLNAVHPQHQRKGIYASLLAAALHGIAKIAPRAVISTQLNNTPVQKVWARLGFEPDHAVYTFHKWYAA